MATSTVENYLKTLFTMQQAADSEAAAGASPGVGLPVAMGQLAREMDVAPGTATAMVKTLSEARLVDYEPRGGCRLTPAGEGLALHVLRRHRLVELFLVEILGMHWSEVHDEAEHLEHAISDKVMDKLDDVLGHPEVDPHGDPIPTAKGKLLPCDLRSLADSDVTGCITVVRIIDQDPKFLQFIDRTGLMPGTKATIELRDPNADSITIRPVGAVDVSLGASAAAKILVEAA
jgi:DtxR family Mn-dependent transcriptional regulator